MPLHIAIFCDVIDNYGDIGVCWRLARQLQQEYQAHVELWVNDLHCFARLAPALNPHINKQDLENISVLSWHHAPENLMPYDWIIEGFACQLPPSIKQQISQQIHTPFYLNLEYLSAEKWVEGCHLLNSPQSLLSAYFYFPGFTEKTGGLLREKNLYPQQQQFLNNPAEISAFWQRLGLKEAPAGKLISLFCYDHAPFATLLEPAATLGYTLLVPEGKASQHLQQLSPQHPNIIYLPFLSHHDYDHLLSVCDLNIVRGEDSIIRAHWANKPFLWHIYPQDENAHLTKLSAFCDLFQQNSAAPDELTETFLQWNKGTLSSPELRHFLEKLPDWSIFYQKWHFFLNKQPDLLTQMMHFYASKVE
jgi:uncharacterized repeat protein (TIGR03837 family)